METVASSSAMPFRHVPNTMAFKAGLLLPDGGALLPDGGALVVDDCVLLVDDGALVLEDSALCVVDPHPAATATKIAITGSHTRLRFISTPSVLPKELHLRDAH
jgi:hypothetical protein